VENVFLQGKRLSSVRGQTIPLKEKEKMPNSTGADVRRVGATIFPMELRAAEKAPTPEPTRRPLRWDAKRRPALRGQPHGRLSAAGIVRGAERPLSGISGCPVPQAESAVPSSFRFHPAKIKGLTTFQGQSGGVAGFHGQRARTTRNRRGRSHRGSTLSRFWKGTPSPWLRLRKKPIGLIGRCGFLVSPSRKPFFFCSWPL
jgi:hypothetical protein